MSFWRAMGIDADMLEAVVDLDPCWEAGYLWVTGSIAEDPDLVEKVSHVLLYLCKWKKFTDSRWITIGPACRVLMWGVSVGLEAWVGLVRADPAASDYHLHGFARLTQAIREWSVVAGLVGNVCDAALAEVMVDDRLAARGEDLKQSMWEE
eukprot:12714325-Alexandrium_andersonii.AAC.1